MYTLVVVVALVLMASPLIATVLSRLTGNATLRKFSSGYDASEVFQRDLNWEKYRWYARHNWKEHN